jgi:hypothetical protein
MRDGDSEPVPSDGAPSDGVASDAVSADAVSADAVAADGGRSGTADSRNWTSTSRDPHGEAGEGRIAQDGDADGPAADGRFRPGNDTVPTHTVEFVRIEGNDALVRYVPGEYVPRGALPAEDPNDRASGDWAGARSGRRRPTPVHALLGTLFWVITVALFITGLTLGIGDDYATSRVIAFIAIGTSIVGFLLGGIAVVLNRGRELGIAAMVLCVVSNPLVLAELLGWISSLTT